jgi:succinate-semialdehyde dehydrogenase/glutarate-semialdehyde dehydrogenase
MTERSREGLSQLDPPPGLPTVADGRLVSTHPATGEEVGRFPVAGAAEVAATVARARPAAQWWAALGFAGRRQRLLRWRSVLVGRLPELTDLMSRECGKPHLDAIVECGAAIDHIAWAAKHARSVLRLRRVRGSLLQPEYSARIEYQPYGVVGAIGPWNYPVYTPVGVVAYALAAGNAVVFKPSEYTPAVGQWLVDRFAEVVPEHPVLQIVHGLGDTGALLCGSTVDKVAFTGSTATGRKVMAACAQRLTPVVIECGGKDAMVVAEDADVAAAADAALWGGMYNAGQTCVGIERVYVASAVADAFLGELARRAAGISAGADAAVGPITMPSQVDTIARHIADGLERGGRPLVGGAQSVAAPYVQPTILVDVPEDAAAVREETFGPVLIVNRVRDADEGIERANASSYGLGGAVFSRRRGLELARRMRSGMTAVNSVLSFAGVPSMPFGGIGDSGFGRVHGADGLREFAQPKAITKRWMRSVVPAATYDRDSEKTSARIRFFLRLLHGRSR